MNPFDLSGGPFLALYAGLFPLALLACWALRNAIRGNAGGAADPLTPAELAWLAGGRARAADAAVVGMVSFGGAYLDTKNKRIAPVPGARRLPNWIVPFHAALDAPVATARIARRFAAPLDAVQAGLAARGLAPDASQAASAGRWSIAPLLLLAGFGAVRIDIGLERGRPVGILVAFVAATLLAALLLSFARPTRTLAGRAALRDWRRRHDRLLRAPQDRELALAFAIGGATVLAGTGLAPFAAWRGLTGTGGGSSDSGGGRDSSGSDSDSGGDSGGGGSGCGGCSS